jgi:hypothetical protein
VALLDAAIHSRSRLPTATVNGDYRWMLGSGDLVGRDQVAVAGNIVCRAFQDAAIPAPIGVAGSHRQFDGDHRGDARQGRQIAVAGNIGACLAFQDAAIRAEVAVRCR